MFVGVGGTVGANKCSANGCSVRAMARLMAVVTNKCSAYFTHILPVFCPCRKRGWQGRARRGERGERGKARRGGEAG